MGVPLKALDGIFKCKPLLLKIAADSSDKEGPDLANTPESTPPRARLRCVQLSRPYVIVEGG